MPISPPLRVVQWATGAVGRYSLRSVITRPEFELAGVLVYDPDKVGKDAGTLVGLPEAGVVCTDDADEILAMDADCVLHMPLPASYFGGGQTDRRGDDLRPARLGQERHHHHRIRLSQVLRPGRGGAAGGRLPHGRHHPCTAPASTPGS